jgi:hypothetical protein
MDLVPPGAPPRRAGLWRSALLPWLLSGVLVFLLVILSVLWFLGNNTTNANGEVGTVQAELAKARAEAASAKSHLAKAQAEIDTLRSALATARAELKKVRQNPQPSPPPSSNPPFVLKPGQPLDRQFAGLVIFAGAMYQGFVRDGTAFATLTGEIGIKLKKESDWDYKIRGVESKPLWLRQDGTLSPMDDIWIDQPYEILDRAEKVVHRHTPRSP